ncbi:MAG: hypothetical protein IVW55_16830 [Chloroflexi bacterium]|nr:hypothetical protein [Chloroflexota bacterium]
MPSNPVSSNPVQSNTESLPIIQLGLGNVGRPLLRQITRAQRRFPWFRIIGVADQSGLCLVPSGLTPIECERLLAAKESNIPLSSWRPRPGPRPGHSIDGEFLLPTEAYGPGLATQLAALGIRRAVVVDLTGTQDLYPMHLALRRAGHHIVLANKWPLAVPFSQYRELWRSGDGFLLHEATVGAALPVIRPLENLVATGDVVSEITALISGTMGYVTSAIEGGTPFSEALRQAQARGYTEPDPRLDLGGVDARRKALILARKIGQEIELDDVRVSSLVPPELEKVPLEEFWRRLPSEDSEYKRKVADAKGNGQALRFLATIRPGSAPQVGLVPVAKDSLYASTRGTESLFAFHTARYSEQPLVIRGQGAGGDLTASGVLADILSIRGEQPGVL